MSFKTVFTELTLDTAGSKKENAQSVDCFSSPFLKFRDHFLSWSLQTRLSNTDYNQFKVHIGFLKKYKVKRRIRNIVTLVDGSRNKAIKEIHKKQEQKQMRMLHSWIPFKAMPSSKRHRGARQT